MIKNSKRKKVNPWESVLAAVLLVFGIIGAVLLALTFSEGRNN